MTPSHLLLNWAILGNKNETTTERSAILFGALMPDVGVWIFSLWFFSTIGMQFGDVWESYYWTPSINVWFNLAHSLVLLPTIALCGYLFNKRLVFLFGMSATMHALCDFFLHADDAYTNFLPFTDWRFVSPVSYWDPAHYGTIFAPVESCIVIIAIFYLYKRVTARYAKVLLILTAVLVTGAGVAHVFAL